MHRRDGGCKHERQKDLAENLIQCQTFFERGDEISGGFHKIGAFIDQLGY
jgi:hypothetical protein